MRKINLIIVSMCFCFSNINNKVDSLLSIMTLDEKIGQMTQVEMRFIKPSDIKDLFIGSLLSGGGGVPQLSTILKEKEGISNNPKSYFVFSKPTKASSPLLYVSTLKPSDSRPRDTDVKILLSSSTKAICVIFF